MKHKIRRQDKKEIYDKYAFLLVLIDFDQPHYVLITVSPGLSACTMSQGFMAKCFVL